MQNDKILNITIGSSRWSKSWQRVQMTISELYSKLAQPTRGAETQKEYSAMTRAQQAELKDVGGFVGGTLKGLRRKGSEVTGRDLITLDFDTILCGELNRVLSNAEALGCSYCIYSTRKHSPKHPRVRVVIPTDRTMTPDEYEPCARRVAEYIGIDMADPTTFEASRLMYWPSCSSDGEFVYKYADKPFLSVGNVLSSYTDWRDFKSWPIVPDKAVSYAKLAMKQGDPTEKHGLIGAFCRTYDIYAAMDVFLPNIYEPTDTDGERFTYLGGSTTGGAIVYGDGKFLYSHHATDPCRGKLVNAFDLVRLHKFGEKDADSELNTPVTKLPSYAAMCDFALTDNKVIATLNKEQQEAAVRDFEGVVGESADNDTAWAEKLKRKKSGAIDNTIDNILIILDGDPLLKGKLAQNLFANRFEVLGALPWQTKADRRTWTDADSDGLYWYLEKRYGITGRGNADSALNICMVNNAFNEVQDFINGLQWDGVPRLDTLFIDYLGASDTKYDRAVCRKIFTAAIARAMQPGCKFDNMLILKGPQGIGKSTLLSKMSKGWFNDSIRTFEGKEASELLPGVWLVEVAELQAFRKSDKDRIKQFLSLQEDRYRPAYGRHTVCLPRCCVFFGTTNTDEYLQDDTGNRRFWPVDVGEKRATRNVWDDLTDGVIDQIWAEAKLHWQCGESLYLTGELESEAQIRQEQHREESVREGLIREFVERKVPEDWNRWTLEHRRDYWAGAIPEIEKIKTVERRRVCALEIWCEVFNGSPALMRAADKREFDGVVSNIPGWEKCKKSLRFGPYGVARGFIKQT